MSNSIHFVVQLEPILFVSLSFVNSFKFHAGMHFLNYYLLFIDQQIALHNGPAINYLRSLPIFVIIFI